MLSARDACVRASAYHATVRERDAANILGISPLLADRDLTPLPSSAEAGKVSRKICGDRDRDVETKFEAYHRQVTLGCYAPPVPDTDSYPFLTPAFLEELLLWTMYWLWPIHKTVPCPEAVSSPLSAAHWTSAPSIASLLLTCHG